MNNIINLKGVRAYLDERATVQLNLEDVARGLGFTRIATSGNEVIRWERVEKHLAGMGLMAVPTCGHDVHSAICGGRPEYISEPYFYWLAMKAGNKTAEDFQRLVCFEILPTIRKHGGHILSGREYLPVQYLGSVATTINTIRRIMIDQGCEADEIAQMAKDICVIYHLPLPEGFVKSGPYAQLTFETTVMTTTLQLPTR